MTAPVTDLAARINGVVTTDNKIVTPSRSTEIDVHNLERMAFTMHLAIIMPPASGGWARLSVPWGKRFHAWVPAVKA